MDLMHLLNTRYSTKEFDASKKISDEDIEKIEHLLQLSPSSTNAQPWHFIFATSDDGKERIAKGAQGFYIFNMQKILDAAAVVVFASKTDVSDNFLYEVLEQEDKDGRYSKEQWKKDTHKVRKIFVDMHKYDYKDIQHWAEKQVYLNLGHFLLGMAHLGIDAIPMEGLDMKVIDQEFNLREKGLTSVIVVAIGYRNKNDFNATLPKSRLNKKEIIERI